MIRKVQYIVLFFLLFFVGSAHAQRDNLYLLAEGKYFAVWGHKMVNVGFLLQKLDYNYFLHPDNLFVDPQQGERNTLAKTIDAIYLEASDVLDIHSYSFQGKVNIVLSQKEVNEVFKEKYGRDFNERSIYFVDEKTIYISEEDLTLGMLGHEIAHAIMNHYFVVPPSTKMQEILAGYVEYSLKKKTATPQIKF